MSIFDYNYISKDFLFDYITIYFTSYMKQKMILTPMPPL